MSLSYCEMCNMAFNKHDKRQRFCSKNCQRLNAKFCIALIFLKKEYGKLSHAKQKDFIVALAKADWKSGK